MSTLTRIDPMSWAKFQAFMMMIMMLVIGIIQLVLISSLGSVINSLNVGKDSVQIGGALAGMGVLGLLIGVPLSGVFGFVTGLISGWLANLILKLTGGIKFELSQS